MLCTPRKPPEAARVTLRTTSPGLSGIVRSRRLLGPPPAGAPAKALSRIVRPLEVMCRLPRGRDELNRTRIPDWPAGAAGESDLGSGVVSSVSGKRFGI